MTIDDIAPNITRNAMVATWNETVYGLVASLLDRFFRRFETQRFGV